MSWVKKKVRNWLSEDTEQEACVSKGLVATSAYIDRNYGNRLDVSGINFKICRATGGYVIETQSYDPKTDRSRSNLYIVTDDQEMGQEISKILTMECLKN